MLTINTILHPTDFSEASDYAFHFACALARDYNARLILLHVDELSMYVTGRVYLCLPCRQLWIPAYFRKN